MPPVSQTGRFSPDERARLKDALIEAAGADPSIEAAALVGSSATGREDDWSDIDLALGLAAGADLDATIGSWTERMHAEHGAVHQVDVLAGGAVYRVFLLASTLQVDLSFWPAGTLRPLGERFRPLFGAIGEAEPSPAPTVEHLAGMAWLYLLHARSSIARGRPLQARHFLGGAWDQVVALACVVHGLPERDGRGADDLPAPIRAEAGRLSLASTERPEAERVLSGLVDLLRGRLAEADAELAARLDPTLGRLRL